MPFVAWLVLLAAAPHPPTRCGVRAVVERRGEATVAALTLTLEVRTAGPRTPVLVGGARAFATDARIGGQPLELVAGPDGLTAVVPTAGDHTLVVTLDAPVSARGPGEVGFEVGLPRAAITTLTVRPPPDVPRLSVTVTAADRPGQPTRTVEPTSQLDRPPDRPGYPLGPAESLAVAWEPPGTRTAGPPVAEIEAAVRVDEAEVATSGTVKVRGPAGAWPLALPAAADADLDPLDGPAATLARSAGGWVLTLPADGPERTVRFAARSARRPGTPIPVGPVAVPAAARQGGTLTVSAAPAVRVDPSPGPLLRRQDAPAEAVAVYRWDVVGPPPPGPLLALDARPAAGGVRVRPALKLRRTEAGWRLDAEVKVTPVRAAVDELAVQLPAGWGEWAVGPPEVAEELFTPPGDGPAVVRLTAPQRAGFDLTLSAVFAAPPAVRQSVLQLPTFPGATVAGPTVVAEVPAGLEIVRGVVRTAAGEVPLDPPAGKVFATGTASPDRPPTAVEVAWQPHRPELTADVRAEVTPLDRQTNVTQVFKLRPADPDGKPIRLRGPAGAVDVRANPAVEAVGPGEWLLRPPADAREVSLTLRYALPGRAVGRQSVGLVWPDATRTTTTARVWAGRRPTRAEGPWRELPPEPSADRDALPLFTLAGSGTGLPLALEFGDGPAPPAVAVERTLVQGWLGPATAVRGRFVLRRWPTGGVLLDLPAGAADVAVWADRRKADPVPDAGGWRVPLPDPRDGRPLLLDVAFNRPGGTLGPVRVHPPRVRDADGRGPVRWHLRPTAGEVLLAGPGLAADLRWGWRGAGFGPVAPAGEAELEHWLDTGVEPDPPTDGGAAVVGRQPGLGAVGVLAVPRPVWLAGCSLAAVGLGLLLVARVPPARAGWAVAAGGAGLAVCGAVYPQPTSEALAAAQPGLAGLAVLLAVRAGGRAVAGWRADHLPGFTRTVPEPTTVSRPPSAGGG